MSEPETQGGPFSRRTAWARSLETPLRAFLRTETGSAAVLLAPPLAALAWVNLDSSSYQSVWHTQLSIRLGDSGISLDLRDWVNTGLMTFFFFVVGPGGSPRVRHGRAARPPEAGASAGSPASAA